MFCHLFLSTDGKYLSPSLYRQVFGLRYGTLKMSSLESLDDPCMDVFLLFIVVSLWLKKNN